MYIYVRSTSSPLSWLVALNGNSEFCLRDFITWQKLSSLRSLTPNSGRFKTTCSEFLPLYSTTFDKKISPTSGLIFSLMAGTTRLELATSCVTGKRSNQLSYAPAFLSLVKYNMLKNFLQYLNLIRICSFALLLKETTVLYT